MRSRRSLLRGIIGLSAGLATLPVLAACGGAAQPPAKPAEPTRPAAANTPGAASPVSKAAGSAEIVYLNQSRGQAKAMDALAAKYTSEKGIKVTIDSPGPTDYPKKLQASSQAGTMPDAYYAIGQADMAPYYKAGFAMNLKPEMDKGWAKKFQKTILQLVEWREGNAFGVPAGIYHAPWEGNSYGVLYNPALLEKAKLDPKKPPTTTTEFVNNLKALKEAGIGPFSNAAEFIPTLLQHYASNYLTDQELDAVNAGRSPWKNDGYKKALQLYVDLRDSGLVFNNALTAGNPDNEKSFFNVQELAYLYTGVFSVPVQVTTAPNFTSYSAFALPRAADAKNDPRSFGGGGKNGVVNPKSKAVDQSLAYIKWLTEKEQEQVFMEMVPLVPTNPEALEPSKVSPQLAAFAKEMQTLQVVPTAKIGPVVEALTKGVQSILLKEKTVDQVLDEADKAQKG
jgi:raffinose/stachyose/melibiose transport system substrate-binding protein